MIAELILLSMRVGGGDNDGIGGWITEAFNEAEVGILLACICVVRVDIFTFRSGLITLGALELG